MSDLPTEDPLQFSISTLVILLCVVAIPLALLSQVFDQDAGLIVALSLGVVVGSMYALVSIADWARHKSGVSANKVRTAIRRPLLALLLTGVFLIGFQVFTVVVD